MATIYGFHDLADAGAFNRRADDVGVDLVNTAITQAMAEHNAQLEMLMRAFVHQTTAFKTVYMTRPSTRNQPLDQFGRPLPIKGWDKYEVGLPLKDSGNAMGHNWQTAATMTVEQVNNTVEALQDGDRKWVMDHILQALFNNVNYEFEDPDHGKLYVKALANDDDQNYHVLAGAAGPTTDDHYLAQANAIGDGADNPFPKIAEELQEHPENGSGQVIAIVPTNLRPAIELLANFHEVRDPNIQQSITRDLLVGTPDVTLPGRYIGYVDEVFIFHWQQMPSGYIGALHTGATGPKAPLAERSHEAPALQGGFIETPGNEDFPWYQRNWIRINGYAAWNRVGAAVMRIGNGSYAIPAGYALDQLA